MISVFPKMISKKAIVTYLVCLVSINFLYSDKLMDFKFIAIGLVSVTMFFMGSNLLTENWCSISDGRFRKKLFWTAFFLRVVWVIFSYFFYKANTGLPYEWGAADSLAYHDSGEWHSTLPWSDVISSFFAGKSVSDIGYPLYLTLLYKIYGPSIIVTRIIKAALGAWTCVLIYELGRRTFGEQTARIGAVMCMLMPNLIYYCGINLKETEMTFLCVAFIERADYLIRSRNYTFGLVVLVSFLALLLFFFRTVIGVLAVFALFTGLIFTSDKIMGPRKRSTLIAWGVAGALVLTGGTIMTEIERYWELRVVNSDLKRESQAETTPWARYATGSVMLPMIFSLPFSTMTDTGQYNQNVIHGGNYVKNMMSLFFYFALFYAFKNKKWRDFSMMGAFVVGYLVIISFSGYANAERFHMPVLPFLMLMASYGMSQITLKNLKYVSYWTVVVFVMEVAWAYFKLGSRGMA